MNKYIITRARWKLKILLFPVTELCFLGSFSSEVYLRLSFEVHPRLGSAYTFDKKTNGQSLTRTKTIATFNGTFND